MFVIRVLGGSGALLLALSMSACVDDGSGAPSDASVENFCDSYFAMFSGGMDDIDPQASTREQGRAMAEALRSWAAEMDEVGTPEDMSDEAREGFELTVRVATGLDAGDVLEDLDDDFSEHELAATQAFEEYATQNCESPFGDPPTL